MSTRGGQVHLQPLNQFENDVVGIKVSLQLIRLAATAHRVRLAAMSRFGSKLAAQQLKALAYVRTDRLSGHLQLELLRREGLERSSRVLEIGCGALSASIPLISFLDRERYVGVDPNRWLREAMANGRVRRLVSRKKAIFLTREDFGTGSLGRSFDFVLSHSILSHAAHRQLEQFLRNTTSVLAPGGIVLASIRLAEGNQFGSKGSRGGLDSMHECWTYPGISWFRFQTVKDLAAQLGLEITVKETYTRLFVRYRPQEFHDWIRIRRFPPESAN